MFTPVLHRFDHDMMKSWPPTHVLAMRVVIPRSGRGDFICKSLKICEFDLGFKWIVRGSRADTQGLRCASLTHRGLLTRFGDPPRVFNLQAWCLRGVTTSVITRREDEYAMCTVVRLLVISHIQGAMWRESSSGQTRQRHTQ